MKPEIFKWNETQGYPFRHSLSPDMASNSGQIKLLNCRLKGESRRVKKQNRYIQFNRQYVIQKIISILIFPLFDGLSESQIIDLVHEAYSEFKEKLNHDESIHQPRN